MNDIIAFLRARLDEDEITARGALHAAPHTGTDDHGTWHANGAEVAGEAMHFWDNPTNVLTEWQASHIARHDPARALREVEAKRRILDRAEQLHDDPFDTVLFTEYDETILPLMAAAYSDHPDYQPHWTT
ncbi:DUF6221 family protein [Prescottella equi]|uniref:Uncharacterized protein n=1 Tax=Prescottella equi ATCC 33707 TaxID=525370 RepID=E9T0K4_RHOHA|nr:DUF6221 family protein [Prescottella equi]EGD23955.1 hypothetical protein HMPREF0724_12163 [Prescottella equi ATCC 33707]